MLLPKFEASEAKIVDTFLTTKEGWHGASRFQNSRVAKRLKALIIKILTFFTVK